MHLTCNEETAGSIPANGSMTNNEEISDEEFKKWVLDQMREDAKTETPSSGEWRCDSDDEGQLRLDDDNFRLDDEKNKLA